MSATQAPHTPTPTRPNWHVSQLAVIRSEFLKLRSVRSTYWTYLIAVGATIGFAAMFSFFTVQAYRDNQLPPGTVLDSTGTSLSGLFLSQLATAILGIMFITSEYACGMIRSTFAAVPKRLPVIWAKLIVLTVVTFALTVGASFVAFFLGQLIFTPVHLEASLSDPGVLRAVIGSSLYLTVMALLGLGLGLIIRHTGAAIGVLVGLVFVLPILTAFLPANIQNNLTKFLPGTAGQAIVQAGAQQPNLLAPWAGFGLFCGYAAILVAVGAYLVKKRDA